MKVVTVMFDSLNRRMLQPYGCDWVKTPNFERLAERTLTFENSYVCSMPCMPARRDIHTGRPNFLHRSWGPIEPFDDSMPEMLKLNGVHSALITDHQHYFEDGGCTYHTKYETWQFLRGQEGDPWMGQVEEEPVPENAYGRNAVSIDRGNPFNMPYQDRINRKFIQHEDQMPQSKTFAAGLDFIERNAKADRWFLQLETFDPHEPFFAAEKYRDLYREAHFDVWEQTDGRLWDWPGYEECNDQFTKEMIEHMRYEYASLVSMCDAKLGLVLDAFDRLNLWEDTMLMVCTDHGFLLGEHDWWAKMRMPWWQELANTPFFIWDPRCGKAGERRTALVQPAIDIAPTVLGCFDLPAGDHMTGKDLRDVCDRDEACREHVMFGSFGGHVNITDGRYVYMRGPAREDNTPLDEYTLMPTHMKHPFKPFELTPDLVQIHEPLSFTKGCSVMKIDATGRGSRTSGMEAAVDFGTLLYDLESDPQQQSALEDESIEAEMIAKLKEAMQEVDAPAEQYERLGLNK